MLGLSGSTGGAVMLRKREDLPQWMKSMVTQLEEKCPKVSYLFHYDKSPVSDLVKAERAAESAAYASRCNTALPARPVDPGPDAEPAERRLYIDRENIYRASEKDKMEALESVRACRGFIFSTIASDILDIIQQSIEYDEAMHENNLGKLWLAIIASVAPEGATKSGAMAKKLIELFSLRHRDDEHVIEFAKRYDRVKEGLSKSLLPDPDVEAMVFIHMLNQKYHSLKNHCNNMNPQLPNVSRAKELAISWSIDVSGNKTMITSSSSLHGDISKNIAMLSNNSSKYPLVVSSNNQNKYSSSNNRFINPNSKSKSNNNNFTKRQTNSNSGKQKKIKCYRCNEFGHLARDCEKPFNVIVAGLRGASSTNSINAAIGFNENYNSIEEFHVHDDYNNNIIDNLDDNNEKNGYLNDTSGAFVVKGSVAGNNNASIYLSKNLDIYVLDTAASMHVMLESERFSMKLNGKKSSLIGVAGASKADKGSHELFGDCLITNTTPFNLVSFSRLIENGFDIKYIKKDNYFIVIKEGLCNIKFELKHNLYVSKIKKIMKNENNYWISESRSSFEVDAPVMIKNVNKVDENKIGLINLNSRLFTKDQRDRAKRARELHISMGHPGNQRLGSLFRRGSIAGVRLTENDIDNSDILFGKCISCMQGKMIRHSSPPSQREKSVKIGERLHIDLMVWSKVMFLVSVDEASGFVNGVRMISKSSRELYESIRSIVNWYKGYRHDVREIWSDRESGIAGEKVSNAIQSLGLSIKLSDTRGHDSTIERMIRVIKERARSINSDLPYRLPDHFVPFLIKYAIQSINLVGNNKIDSIPAIEMVTGRQLNHRDVNFAFGDVVLAKDPYPAASEAPRSYFCIVLGRDLRSNGTKIVWKIGNPMNSVMYRTNLTKIPISDKLVSILNGYSNDTSVRDFEMNKKTHIIKGKNIKTSDIYYDNEDEDTNNNDGNVVDNIVDDSGVIGDDFVESIPAVSGVDGFGMNEGDNFDTLNEMEKSYNNDNEEYKEDGEVDESKLIDNIPPNIASFVPSTPLKGNISSKMTPKSMKSTPNDPISTHKDHDINQINIKPNQNNVYEATGTNSGVKSHLSPVLDHVIPFQQNFENNKIINEINPNVPINTNINNSESYTLRRSQRTRNEVKRYVPGESGMVNLNENHCCLSFSKALKMYPEPTKKGLEDEIKQLFDRGTFNMIRKQDIGKSIVIPTLAVAADKGDGKIKVRIVANGAHQAPGTLTYEQVSSPTLRTPSLMILLAISACSGRRISAYDVKGAYLQASLPKDTDIVVKFNKDITDIMKKIEPTIETDHNGFSYGRLSKALYGLKQAGRLWYHHLVNTLRCGGYECLKYDRCIMKRKEGNEIHYIAIYVDDLLVITKDENERKRVRTILTNAYGELKQQEKDIIIYRGLTIDQKHPNEIRLSQTSYIQALCDQFNINKISKTPSTASLLEIDLNAKPSINPDRFRNGVAKLLWISSQTRPDLKFVASFLSSRLVSPTIDDDRKLIHVLKYLNGTKHIELIYKKYNIVANASVDASHMVNADTRGQTGVHIRIGGNLVDAISKKQTITAMSSAEAELIALNTGINALLWCRYLLNELGYPQKTSIIYQDNMSTISIAESGYPTQRTKHMNLRYFRVKELIENKEITLQHLRTEHMDADIQTKHLPDAQFTPLRDMIMNGDLRGVLRE